MARLLDVYAKRLQIREAHRPDRQHLNDVLQPRGVAV